jgi:hypothetical protein
MPSKETTIQLHVVDHAVQERRRAGMHHCVIVVNMALARHYRALRKLQRLLEASAYALSAGLGQDHSSALLAWNVRLFCLRKRRVGISTYFLKDRWNPRLAWVSGQPSTRTHGFQSTNFSLG